MPQVQKVLAKLALCRTSALGGHTYECPQCQHRCQVYNSCLDRHCPLCGGGRRADWLAKTSQLLLPNIDYFQVVFTLPDDLWPLMLGNRRPTYRLLFHAAWEALQEVLREELGCEPAALMVLHTWNQHLEHFPHLHALVPGGGPSKDGQQWVRSKPHRVQGQDKPYLVDNRVLSARFRDKFLAGLTRLHRDGQLKLTDRWSALQDPAAFGDWLRPLSDCDWVVFIEPPPTEHANPEHVLKYLARYLTGGPISDRRLIDHQDGRITFWARGHDKKSGNQRKPCSLSGTEFTRRWALHILPKGFIKSRCFGGFSCRHRKTYLHCCVTLLDLQQAVPAAGPEAAPEAVTKPAEESPTTPCCPRCQTPMTCISEGERVSWRKVFDGRHRPAWYDPFNHAIRWGCRHWLREPPDG